jgi:hemoglobin-like flavoprotein
LSSVAENVLDALAAARIELAFRSGSLIPGQDQEEVGRQDPGPTAPPLAPSVVRLRPDAPAVPDPKGILSRDDIARIRESWTQAAPLREQMAVLFYDRLFEAAPSLRRLFRSDAATQRIKLVTMLAMLVKALDRPEILLETLADLGLRHHTYGVQPGDYDAVGEALVWTLGQTLGEAFDPPTREAWSRLYGVISGTMIRASGRAVA